MADKEFLQAEYKNHYGNAVELCKVDDLQAALEELKLAADAAIKLANVSSDQERWICVARVKSIARIISDVKKKLDGEDDAKNNAVAPGSMLDKAVAELESLKGLKGVKDEIKHLTGILTMRLKREEAGLPNPQISLHCIFAGAPGTGKRTVAGILAKIYCALKVCDKPEVTYVSLSDIISDEIAVTGNRMQELVDKAVGGVLFIEGIDQYFLSDSRSYKEAMNVIYCVLASCRRDITLILAGDPEGMHEFARREISISTKIPSVIDFSD